MTVTTDCDTRRRRRRDRS